MGFMDNGYMNNPNYTRIANENLQEMEELGIIRRQPQPTNNLEGLVMTSTMARMRKLGTPKITIRALATNEALRKKFPKGTFPNFREDVGDGIFFEPVARVISPMEVKVSKWFSLSSNFDFAHDHDYPYARLQEDGYLLRVDIHGDLNNLEFAYLTPVNNIQYTEIMNPETLGDHGELMEAQMIYNIETMELPQKLQGIFVGAERVRFSKEYLEGSFSNFRTEYTPDPSRYDTLIPTNKQ